MKWLKNVSNARCDYETDRHLLPQGKSKISVEETVHLYMEPDCILVIPVTKLGETTC